MDITENIQTEVMNMDISERLQELRKKEGYSQEQVAEMLGLSRQAISKWEIQTLQTIASHYNKPVDELLHTDLTKLGELSLNLNSISGIVELLNVMLPLYCTDAAMKSDSFKKGYKLSQRLLDGFANAEILPGNVIGRIFEKYLNAADESEELGNGREILDAGFLCLHPVDVLI